MHFRQAMVAACSAGLLFVATSALAQTQAARTQRMADSVVVAYNARNYDALVRLLSIGAKALVTVEELRRHYDALHASAGRIVSLGTPAFFNEAIAIYPATFEHKVMELSIALDDAGKIRGLEFNERKTTVARNRTTLRLPFEGEWIVMWGGDKPELNYHQSISLARLAFDFQKVDAQGRAFMGDGTRNEDYYSFGQEIVAPADGVVTDVITGVRDNTPGTVNNFADIGNMVMVEHASGEVSVLAHFKFGSIRVAVGDHVARGQPLGLSGNSGNSVAPHLHYQLQERPVPAPESTIKVFFDQVDLRRNVATERRRDYSPVKGDMVKSPRE